MLQPKGSDISIPCPVSHHLSGTWWSPVSPRCLLNHLSLGITAELWVNMYLCTGLWCPHLSLLHCFSVWEPCCVVPLQNPPQLSAAVASRVVKRRLQLLARFPEEPANRHCIWAAFFLPFFNSALCVYVCVRCCCFNNVFLFFLINHGYLGSYKQ